MVCSTFGKKDPFKYKALAPYNEQFFPERKPTSSDSHVW